jgi:hypothetical protein
MAIPLSKLVYQVSKKNTVFWDTTLCSPLKVRRCFGGKHRLHLKAEK